MVPLNFEIHFKNRRSWRLPVFFVLIFFSATVSGQSSTSRIDSVYCMSANDSLFVTIFNLGRGFKDSNCENLYLALERHVAKNDFVFLKFNVHDDQFEYKVYVLPDSVQRDLDYSVYHCYAAHGVMYIESDRNYEFDLASCAFLGYESAHDQELLYTSLDYKIRGLYYNYHPLDHPFQSVISCTRAEDGGIKNIYPPKHEIELTHFRPCNLLRANERYVIRSSVSRPVVYLYNHELELLDSLSFLPAGEWKDAESIFSKKETRVMNRKKFSVFDYYMKAFDRGIYKAQNIDFTGPDRFYLAYRSPWPEFGVVTFMVDELNRIRLCEQGPTVIPRVQNQDLQSSAPINIYESGIFCAGKFYLWEAGGCETEVFQDENNQPVQTPSCAYQPPGIRLLECTVPH